VYGGPVTPGRKNVKSKCRIIPIGTNYPLMNRRKGEKAGRGLVWAIHDRFRDLEVGR